MRFAFSARAVLPVLFFALSAQADIFKVTDLGTLGGSTSVGTGINNLGQVVGYSLLLNGTTNGFFWTDSGGMVNFSPTSADTRAFAINDSGKIVGQTDNQAFAYTPLNGMILLDPGFNGAALDVNNSGVSVGYREDGANDRTVVWNASNGAIPRFPTANTKGTAIDEDNQIVGTQNGDTSGYHNSGASNFRTQLGSFLPFDYYGQTAVGSDNGVATSWDLDLMQAMVLGKLFETDTSSTARGINSLGWVTGDSSESGAFLWKENSLLSINSMLRPEDQGWFIESGNDINDNGLIIGTGYYITGQRHAVLLEIQVSAVPEPGLFAVVQAPAQGIAEGARWIEKQAILRCEREADCSAEKLPATTRLLKVERAQGEEVERTLVALDRMVKSGRFSEKGRKLASEAMERLSEGN